MNTVEVVPGIVPITGSLETLLAFDLRTRPLRVREEFDMPRLGMEPVHVQVGHECLRHFYNFDVTKPEQYNDGLQSVTRFELSVIREPRTAFLRVIQRVVDAQDELVIDDEVEQERAGATVPTDQHIRDFKSLFHQFTVVMENKV